MATAKNPPLDLRRADFLALINAIVGCGFLFVSAWMFLSNGISISVVAEALAGLLMILGATYTHLKPEATTHGTQLAPRTWYELTGVIVASLLLLIAGAIILSATIGLP